MDKVISNICNPQAGSSENTKYQEVIENEDEIGDKNIGSNFDENGEETKILGNLLHFVLRPHVCKNHSNSNIDQPRFSSFFLLTVPDLLQPNVHRKS